MAVFWTGVVDGQAAIREMVVKRDGGVIECGVVEKGT